jgi:hypothetical protein
MNNSLDHDEMPSEIDFSKGKRGLHYIDPAAAHTVRIFKEDGTVEVQHHQPALGTFRLDFDLQKKFPNSESVNKALRSYLATVEGR